MSTWPYENWFAVTDAGRLLRGADLYDCDRVIGLYAENHSELAPDEWIPVSKLPGLNANNRRLLDAGVLEAAGRKVRLIWDGLLCLPGDAERFRVALMENFERVVGALCEVGRKS